MSNPCLSHKNKGQKPTGDKISFLSGDRKPVS
jgi:hypothetical protein